MVVGPRVGGHANIPPNNPKNPAAPVPRIHILRPFVSSGDGEWH